MEDQNKPIANPELTAAVERMNRENSRESREAVLDLVITTARFLAPVTITPAPEEQAGGQTALGQGTQIQFQLLTNQEGQPFFPAFTGWEELRKLCGPKNQQTLVLTFDDYTAKVVRDTRAAGNELDPIGPCLTIAPARVEHLVERKRQMTDN